MPIKDMDNLEKNQEDLKVNDFVKSADMSNKKSRKGIGGRPKKSEDEKANNQIFVNLTQKQKEDLEQYAKNTGLSVSAVAKMALKQLGAI